MSRVLLGQRGATTVARVWKAYGRSGLRARLRVVIRYLVCPYSSFVEHFPSSGDILDAGCGDGVLALMLSLKGKGSSLRYVGIDHAESKIQVAKSVQISNADFLVQDVADIPSESYDCVSLIDVLYCIPLVHWPNFLGHCTRALRKGGLLIIKETTDRPRWKSWFTYIEEVLAIRVFKMTKGASPHLESLDTYRSYMEMSGARVYHVQRLDSWRPHPHCLFLARKS